MTPPINITTSPNVGQISPQQGTEAIDSSNDLPPELEKPKSSFWKTLGRIGLGIVTGSLSELIPLAWKGIQWICSKISGGSERQAQVPANQDPLPQTNPAADKINSSVIAGLKDNAKMPAAFSAAANEALAELRQTYGEGCVPKDATLSSMKSMLSTKLANAGSDAGKGLFLTVKNAEEPLTPEGFKSMIKQNFAQDLNRLTLLDTVSQSLADKPLLSAASPVDILINVLKDPALQGISSATSPEQVNSLAEQCKLESFLTKLEQDMQQTLDQLRETYGEAVPQSTQELMNLTIENGQKLSKQISDHFTHCTQPVTVENGLRVFSDREFLDWYRLNKSDVRNWPLRLRQLLGLSREDKITHFSTLWVDPKNIIRSAYNPDITSSEMACRFEDGDDSQLDSIGMWHRNWFDKAWSTSYRSRGGHPWTRLGYTYDWGAEGRDKYGLSEFLVVGDATVNVHTTKDLKTFVRWLGDRN